MRFLLDTNVLRHLANRASGWERIRSKIDNVGASHCAISADTAYELRQHIERGPARVRLENIERLKAIYAGIECMDLNPETAAPLGCLPITLSERSQLGLTEDVTCDIQLVRIKCVHNDSRMNRSRAHHGNAKGRHTRVSVRLG